ncbi:AAA family ATPase [Rhodanobacter sp. AS-Z3]|uniref:ATP-dependent nuclease n=1 Tax=Rhodanobacter sp. AS-Z3 TaxID=3031330 RepID=UPI00247A2FD1|nr:AAA family ATPase [Rhodanobacter sp. AS-Z3]WEN15110.1 AAA family ATPase [Rhodanobacter sp. AS-Z3]
MTSKAELIFNPSLQLFAQTRAGSPLTVLSGSNNSGKSLTLKWLKSALGRSAYMIGTNRFYHVYHLSTGIRDPSQLDQFENQFQSNFNQENYNHEQNPFDLNQIIMGLSDKRRSELFELCGKLIGNTFSMKKVDSENELSPRYIDMDGQNLSVGSTGTRLLMTILGICMDERFETVLIDEPELGLSPKVQQMLSTFFDEPETRSKIFPHLSRIYLATHSHLMLSRRDITSNYVVSKNAATISIQRVKNIGEFHRLQFNLLGNSLESMYFPSAIVVVEGKTDHAYLDRVLQLQFPEKRIAVIHSGGDVKKKVHSLKETLGELDKSPLRARIFVVLDSVHQPGLRDELTKLGVLEENVVTWSQNGIEYVYPPKVVAGVFCASVEDVHNLSLVGDRISLNDITKTKNELAASVVSLLREDSDLPSELVEKLIDPVSAAIM